MQCSTDSGRQASAVWSTCGMSPGPGVRQRQRPAPLRQRKWPRRYRHWRTRPLLLYVWLVGILHEGTVLFVFCEINITSPIFSSSLFPSSLFSLSFSPSSLFSSFILPLFVPLLFLPLFVPLIFVLPLFVPLLYSPSLCSPPLFSLSLFPSSLFSLSLFPSSLFSLSLFPSFFSSSLFHSSLFSLSLFPSSLFSSSLFSSSFSSSSSSSSSSSKVPWWGRPTAVDQWRSLVLRTHGYQNFPLLCLDNAWIALRARFAARDFPFLKLCLLNSFKFMHVTGGSSPPPTPPRLYRIQWISVYPNFYLYHRRHLLSIKY